VVRVRVVDGAKLRARLACKGPATVRCDGRVTLLGRGRHRRKVGLGGRNVHLRGGRSHTIIMGLDARGRGLLRAAHHLRVRMAITQGKRSVLNRRYALQLPRPRHRHAIEKGAQAVRTPIMLF
jgi:hypothetical protein